MLLRILLQTLVFGTAVFFSSLSMAELQLKQVHLNPLALGQIELKLEFTEDINEYVDKLEYSPHRLVILIPDASSRLALNPVTIKRGNLLDLTTERINLGLKVIIALKELMPYTLIKTNNSLIARFGIGLRDMRATVAGDPTVLTAASKEVLLTTTYGRKVSAEARTLDGILPLIEDEKSLNEDVSNFVNQVRGIDFRAGSEGSGKLILTMKNSAIAVDIKQEEKTLIATFQKTAILKQLLYILDVADFGTPVNAIETFYEDGTAVFKMNVKDDFSYRYEQADNILVIEITENNSDEKSSQYKGQAISLNFQDIPVRTVLQLIADFNEFNLVTTDSVDGNITLHLDSVPWEQALDIVMKIKGLSKQLDGNVLMVAPTDEFAALERRDLVSKKEVAELAELKSEFIQMNFAKASDMVALLAKNDASLLSSRGSMSADERTNTLIVKDTSDVIANVKRIIDILDVAVRQVTIEARMVSVVDDMNDEFGIRWGGTGGSSSGDRRTSTSGSIGGNDSAAAGEVPSIDDRLNVNLPVANPAGTIAFQVSKLANGQILDLELSALESEQKAEVIASPRITTTDQKSAYIEQGTEIPYVESSSSGATSITFKKAILGLKVTPHITPNNKIILDLVVNQDTRGEDVKTAGGEAVSIDTQEISTQVLVENGETIVLGGIFKHEIKRIVTKVPILGDIPWLGVLFRSTKNINEKRELLIFVTPKVVVDTL